MIIVNDEYVTLDTPDGPMRTHIVRPAAPGRYPGIVFYSEIFQITAPIRRTAAMLAGHGYIVALPEIYHEFEAAGTVFAYYQAGSDRGNELKTTKKLASYDTDARAVLDHLAARPDCTGKLGAMGICIGGHLAFRAAMNSDVIATACFYATDIHKGSLGAGMNDDSLERAKDIEGELLMIWGRQDPHIALEGRMKVLARLNDLGTKLSWHVKGGTKRRPVWRSKREPFVSLRRLLATADLNSYGFRPKRSTADAIEQCFNAVGMRNSARWVLEGDIRGCFDNISPEWMLDHILTAKEVLRKWLKAGFMENRMLLPTEAGTPQGGIIAPTLANLTLDGLEQLLKQTSTTTPASGYAAICFLLSDAPCTLTTVRINPGKTEQPAFLRRLSATLAIEVFDGDLIDLEESDHAMHLVREGCSAVKQARESGFARFFSKDDEYAVFALVSCLKAKLGNRRAILYFRQSGVCGAVATSTFASLARTKSLLGVDGDGINMISESHEDGLMLDFNRDDDDCCYELIVWGATWPVLALACL